MRGFSSLLLALLSVSIRVVFTLAAPMPHYNFPRGFGGVRKLSSFFEGKSKEAPSSWYEPSQPPSITIPDRLLRANRPTSQHQGVAPTKLLLENHPRIFDKPRRKGTKESLPHHLPTPPPSSPVPSVPDVSPSAPPSPRRRGSFLQSETAPSRSASPSTLDRFDYTIRPDGVPVRVPGLNIAPSYPDYPSPSWPVAPVHVPNQNQAVHPSPHGFTPYFHSGQAPYVFYPSHYGAYPPPGPPLAPQQGYPSDPIHGPPHYHLTQGSASQPGPSPPGRNNPFVTSPPPPGRNNPFATSLPGKGDPVV